MRFRNAFLLCSLAATLAVAGCSTTSSKPETAANEPAPATVQVATNQIFNGDYGAVEDHGYALPAIPISKVDTRFHRQIVDYATSERP